MPCTLLTPVASAMPVCQAGLSPLFLPMNSIRMLAPMPPHALYAFMHPQGR